MSRGGTLKLLGVISVLPLECVVAVSLAVNMSKCVTSNALHV